MAYSGMKTHRSAAVIGLMCLSFVAGYGLARLRGRPYPVQQPRDPFGLEKYKDANTRLAAPPSVVFFGDSIIELWDLEQFFPGKGYVNRGIGGQATAEMLGRFYQDVIDLKPSFVVICGGVNDRRLGLPVEESTANIKAMCDIAVAHNIKSVIARVSDKTVDGVHPSDEGYREMSERLVVSLNPKP